MRFTFFCLCCSDGDSIKVVVRVRPQREIDHGMCLQVDSAKSRVIMNSKPEKIYTFDLVTDMSVTQVHKVLRNLSCCYCTGTFFYFCDYGTLLYFIHVFDQSTGIQLYNYVCCVHGGHLEHIMQICVV